MRKRIYAVILMLAMLLCGCGGRTDGGEAAGAQQDGSQQGDDGNTEEIPWRLEETKLPDGAGAAADGASEVLYGLSGETLYRIAETSENSYIQTLKPPYTEWETVTVAAADWVEGRSCGIHSAALCGDTLRMVLTDREEAGAEEEAGAGETQGWCLAEWTPEKGLHTDPIVSEGLDDEFFSHISSFYTAGDGVSYFMTTTEGVAYFDSTFQEKKTWPTTDWVWQFVENGADDQVYFCGSSERGGFAVWTVKSREPVFLSSDLAMDSTGRVVFSTASEGYLCMPQGIWRFDLDSGELEKRMDFREEGYSVEQVYGVQINAEGNLLMAVEARGERLLLETTADESQANQQDQQDQQEQKELVLALYSAGTFLSQAVNSFNRQGGEYYITLQERGDDENYDDYTARMQAEIGSGDGPDLFVTSFINLQDAVSQGLLRNLDEDLAEEQARMLENARAAGQVRGELYALPYEFQLRTLLASSDIVGDRESWTAEEFVEYVKTSGAQEAIERTGGADLFWYLVSHGDLIDWENNKSDLGSSKAVEYLEFAKEYATPAEDLMDYSSEGWLNSFANVAEGRTLTTTGYVSDVVNNYSWEAEFQGKAVYIGFPVENAPGQNGNQMMCQMLAVSQSCKYPEGAVLFLRHLLAKENQLQLSEWDPVTGYGEAFPVDAEALEYTFEYAREHREELPSTIVYKGTQYEYESEAPGDEQLDKLRNMLLSARPEIYNVEPVQNIILEETPAYFNGDKTAQEVCDTIQNRVQLYLDEIR